MATLQQLVYRVVQDYSSSTPLQGSAGMHLNPCGLQADNDDRSRPCSVTLYRRPVAGPLGYHWALHFDWNDYEAYYDANDANGILTPSWGKGKPAAPPGSLQINVGKGHFSPKMVNTSAMKNKLNCKMYVLTKMNCQHWARELACMMGLIIPIPCNVLQTVAPAVSDAVDVFHFFGKHLAQNETVRNHLGNLRNDFLGQSLRITNPFASFGQTQQASQESQH